MSLLQRLRDCVSDDREIEPILSYASGGGARLLSRGRVEFCLADPEDTLYATVSFKRGSITKITPGPALMSKAAQDFLLEKAANETANIHGIFTAQRVLFSERKLTGHYVWQDRFQIDPCPTSAPIGTGLNWFGQTDFNQVGEAPDGPPYPFTLLVHVADSPNPLLRSSRSMHDLDTFQHLLTLLVSGHIRTFDRVGERVWTLTRRENGIENHLLHPGFTTGDETASATTPAPFYQGDDYYNHLWCRDSEIFLPPSIEQDIEAFHLLDAEEARKFRRAMYWYALGIRNRKEAALSTVAFSTAIECLLPNLSRPRCTVCKSELGRGPTHLFKAHLNRYGTVPESLHKQRSELYAVRSALVHGSFASSVDTGMFSVGGDTFDQDILLELVTRRSLLNWLRDPARKTWYEQKAET
jgi:hypothetical protein